MSRHQTENEGGALEGLKIQSVLATMACCKAPVDSDPETQVASKQIDSQLRQDRRDEANRITLLLLGTNSFRKPNFALSLLYSRRSRSFCGTNGRKLQNSHEWRGVMQEETSKSRLKVGSLKACDAPIERSPGLPDRRERCNIEEGIC